MIYNPHLKQPARQLRQHQTLAELALWQRLRRKQIHGVQFYRQRPLDRFIVDFYCPAACLIIECDGSQHHTPEGLYQDQQRDMYLKQKGLQVIRFDNHQVLTQLDAVCMVIAQTVIAQLNTNPP
ncbi:MAG: endonuclease domain-containing protein [Pseudomonadales bacterium]|nr:endonuclease domain-containing protein [Pseudomonadales bacterium]